MEETVRFADTDAADIVYFGAFATYFDESFLTALRQKGLGCEKGDERKGITSAVDS